MVAALKRAVLSRDHRERSVLAFTLHRFKANARLVVVPRPVNVRLDA